MIPVRLHFDFFAAVMNFEEKIVKKMLNEKLFMHKSFCLQK
jgi:hypothetical protein